MHPIAISVLFLIVAMVSIQTGAAVAKQLFPLLGAPGTAALRLFFAALMLGILWRPWRGPLSRKDVLHVSCYGAALGCMNFLFYLALARIPLGIAVALEFTGPLLLAVLSSRRVLDLLWVGLAAAGIVMIFPSREFGSSLDAWGITFALGAGACWALYILFGQRLGAALHGGRASALGMAVAALCVVPLGVAAAGTKLLNPAVLPVGLAVALFSSALPYSLEMYALKNLPARTFGILMSMEPAMAALSGFVILGERLTPTQWLATGAVIAASLGTSLSAASTSKPPASAVVPDPEPLVSPGPGSD